MLRIFHSTAITYIPKLEMLHISIKMFFSKGLNNAFIRKVD